MRVVLAGYNVDSAVIDELKRNAPPREDVTPETLSASYARISRDPRPVDELRAAARAEVDRTRRSNQSIIFKMGHHSVAEHAVFNFDVVGVSRLAIEEIERFRLLSFTEKSQRYITLGEDFVVPEEVRRAGREALFVGTVKAQNALYHKLYARLKPFVFAKNAAAAAEPGNHAVLDGWAKEDARYAVSLATEGQLGLTANARNLELLIRRFAAKGLAEVRELSARLYELARSVAPSIILFTDPSPFDAETYADLAAAADELERSRRAGDGPARARPKASSWPDTPPDGDTRTIAALLHSVTRLSYKECLARAAKAGPAARQRHRPPGLRAHGVLRLPAPGIRARRPRLRPRRLGLVLRPAQAAPDGHADLAALRSRPGRHRAAVDPRGRAREGVPGGRRADERDPRRCWRKPSARPPTTS
ncbi:MAG: FAD-dependent thymidylate synthase [Candidatus Moduliflexus flocculans]|nr:FAD-dependent thymidylate synthase [Candidatus Moduliflexus flocculans]